jgi:hypothetical protein
MHASLGECHILFAGLGLQLTPLLPSSSVPTSLCNILVSTGPRVSRVVFGTWASHRRHVTAVSYRDRSVQSPRHAQTEFLRDRLHHKQFERDRYRNVSGIGILKILKILKIFKKFWKFEKFHLQIFFKIFNFFYFARFSDNFQHYMIFRKIFKFFQRSHEEIHASLGEFHILFAGLGLHLTPILPSSSEPTGLCSTLVSAGPRVSRVVFRTWASQRRHIRAVSYRYRSVQSPRHAQTEYLRDRLHHKQFERDRYRIVSGGRILKIFKKLNKCWKLYKQRTKQKKLKNFTFKIFSKIFVFLR